jgi:hypothetical protein
MVREFAYGAVMVVVLGVGCARQPASGVARPSTSSSPIVNADAMPEIIAGGTELTPDGAIARRSASDDTARGGAYFISVDMRGASRRDVVEVVWYGPDGKSIRNDRKRIPLRARHVVFSTGETRGWQPGRYLAEVYVNGRKATVKPFKLS